MGSGADGLLLAAIQDRHGDKVTDFQRSGQGSAVNVGKGDGDAIGHKLIGALGQQAKLAQEAAQRGLARPQGARAALGMHGDGVGANNLDACVGDGRIGQIGHNQIFGMGHNVGRF